MSDMTVIKTCTFIQSFCLTWLSLLTLYILAISLNSENVIAIIVLILISSIILTDASLDTINNNKSILSAVIIITVSATISTYVYQGQTITDLLVFFFFFLKTNSINIWPSFYVCMSIERRSLVGKYLPFQLVEMVRHNWCVVVQYYHLIQLMI